MEIKKFLGKIYEIYSDFTSLFQNVKNLSTKDTTNNELLITKTDLKSQMIAFHEKNINITNPNPENQNNNEKEDSNIITYIDLFLNLMFDEVKKFKIIRPKKTGSK